MAKPLINDSPLSRRQKKFVKKVIETGNQRKAASLAGFDPNYGNFLARQPKIQTALQAALDKAGLDDVKVADLLKKGTEAYYVKKDGGKKYPDFHARDKSIDKIIKIKGGYAPEKHEIKQEKLTLVITSETLKGLKDAEAITEAEIEEVSRERLEE